MNEDSPGKPEEGHETRDANVRGVAWFAVGLVVMLAVIFFAVRSLFGLFSEHRPTTNTHISGPSVLPPEPRLQSDPAADLARFREQENATLNSYGWMDRQAGVVRIPIERAMDLVVQRGFSAAQFSSGKTPLQMRQEKANAEKPRP